MRKNKQKMNYKKNNHYMELMNHKAKLGRFLMLNKMQVIYNFNQVFKFFLILDLDLEKN